MAKEYRKRLKEQYGKGASLGQDVISTSVIAVSGVVGHTVLTTNGLTTGCNRFVLPRGGYLDYLVVNVSPTITTGSLNVALYKAGALVASGSLTSTNPDRIEKFYDADAGNEVAVASGNLIQTFYSISTALSPGVTSYAIDVRAGITYRESV